MKRDDTASTKPDVARRLDESAFRDPAWLIHPIVPDFDVEDVWHVPVRLTPATFQAAMHEMMQGDPSDAPSPIYRFLFQVRWTLGRVFGWDAEDEGIGSRVPSLRERMSPELRSLTPAAPASTQSPFTPLLLTDDEYAAELANATCHGVLHVGLVPQGSDYDVRLSVLVRPNGRLGRAYMAFIKPFRYLFVYPVLLRTLAKEWGAAGTES